MMIIFELILFGKVCTVLSHSALVLIVAQSFFYRLVFLALNNPGKLISHQTKIKKSV